MKKKKQRISDLFYDNRFLFVFSVVLAVVFWLIVVISLGVEVENTVDKIPVQIDYSKIESDFGLKPYGETSFTVDVTIRGKKYVVESDDVYDDIRVEAITGYVNAPGQSTLRLKVEPKSENYDYDIINCTATEVSVYFDYPGEKEFVVEPEIEFDGEPVAEGYHVGDFIFPESDTVRVTGPKSEIDKIDRVIARADVEGKLNKNVTVDAELFAVPTGNEALRYISFGSQSNEMKITVPVSKIGVMNLSCGFVNKPSAYIENPPLKVTVSPASAKLAVPEKKLEGMTSFEIMSIDYSQLRNGINVFTVTSENVTGADVVDDVKEFTVTVDVRGMSSKTFAAPETVSFVNVPTGVEAELSAFDFTEITVIGPAESLRALNSENLVLTADLSGVSAETDGEVTVPVSLSDDDCWTYGSLTAKVKLQ